MRRIRTVNSKAKLRNENGELVPSPCIVLQGKHVAKLGFKEGDKILVCGRAELIVVKLLKSE